MKELSKKYLSRKEINLFSKSFVTQLETKDCAAACLASISNYCGHKSTIAEVGELCGTDDNGTTMLGLIQGANYLGFDCEAFKATGIQNLESINHPSILHVVSNRKFYHYVVFFGQTAKDLYLIGDPDRGVITITKFELEEIWESRILLKLTFSGSPNKKSSEEARAKKIKGFLLSEKPVFFMSIFLGILIAMISISSALFYQNLIDKILPSKDFKKLIPALFLLTLLLMVNLVLSYFRSQVIFRQSKSVNVSLFESFLQNLIYLPKSFFDKRKIGDLTSRLIDIRNIEIFLTQSLGGALINLIQALCFTIAIIFFSPQIGLIVILTIITSALVIFSIIKKIGPLQKEVLTKFALAESSFIDILKGVEIIKAFRREKSFLNMMFGQFSNYQNSIFTLNQFEAKFNLAISIVMTTGTAVVILTASLLTLNGKLRIGEVFAILFLASGAISSIVSFIPVMASVNKVKVSYSRLVDLLLINGESSDEKEGQNILVTKFSLVNITFGFIGKMKILKGLSMEAEKGQIVLIQGSVGSGKSVLFSIIQRTLLPQNGSAIVASYEREFSWMDFTLNSWRTLFGVVPQDVFIFSGTILQNICVNLSPSKDETERALNLYQLILLEHFKTFSDGYNTLIGQGGVKLSGGQIKLIGFTRALFNNPMILLLDEFTSGMDSSMEEFVVKILKEIKSQMIIIAITHKKLLGCEADKNYLLEEGFLKEIQSVWK